jgi:hypothetical protein
VKKYSYKFLVILDSLGRETKPSTLWLEASGWKRWAHFIENNTTEMQHAM